MGVLPEERGSAVCRLARLVRSGVVSAKRTELGDSRRGLFAGYRIPRPSLYGTEHLMSSCCNSESDEPQDEKPRRFQWLLTICGLICLAAVIIFKFNCFGLMDHPRVSVFAHGVVELLSKMWLGLAFGIVAIGILGQIPREVITNLLGKGILRAMFLGLFLDLCSHGILLVGAKLYQRGATLGQTFAFLTTSPWNSISLTFVLFGLIGIRWTLVFIVLSAAVGFFTGVITDWSTSKGWIASNPNRVESTDPFSFQRDVRDRLKNVSWRPSLFLKILKTGILDSVMLVRWLLLGVITAATLRALIPEDAFGTWFGPTLGGLALTMVATTLIEVCSEGSSPIASDLLNRAGAPGNAFAFLMGGVATDYTEIMVLREATGSWKLTFLLPLFSVPQIILLGALLNYLGK